MPPRHGKKNKSPAKGSDEKSANVSAGNATPPPVATAAAENLVVRPDEQRQQKQAIANKVLKALHGELEKAKSAPRQPLSELATDEIAQRSSRKRGFRNSTDENANSGSQNINQTQPPAQVEANKDVKSKNESTFVAANAVPANAVPAQQQRRSLPLLPRPLIGGAHRHFFVQRPAIVSFDHHPPSMPFAVMQSSAAAAAFGQGDIASQRCPNHMPTAAPLAAPSFPMARAARLARSSHYPLCDIRQPPPFNCVPSAMLGRGRMSEPIYGAEYMRCEDRSSLNRSDPCVRNDPDTPQISRDTTDADICQQMQKSHLGSPSGFETSTPAQMCRNHSDTGSATETRSTPVRQNQGTVAGYSGLLRPSRLDSVVGTDAGASGQAQTSRPEMPDSPQEIPPFFRGRLSPNCDVRRCSMVNVPVSPQHTMTTDFMANHSGRQMIERPRSTPPTSGVASQRHETQNSGNQRPILAQQRSQMGSVSSLRPILAQQRNQPADALASQLPITPQQQKSPINLFNGLGPMRQNWQNWQKNTQSPNTEQLAAYTSMGLPTRTNIGTQVNRSATATQTSMQTNHEEPQEGNDKRDETGRPIRGASQVDGSQESDSSDTSNAIAFSRLLTPQHQLELDQLHNLIEKVWLTNEYKVTCLDIAGAGRDHPQTQAPFIFLLGPPNNLNASSENTPTYNFVLPADRPIDVKNLSDFQLLAIFFHCKTSEVHHRIITTELKRRKWYYYQLKEIWYSFSAVMDDVIVVGKRKTNKSFKKLVIDFQRQVADAWRSPVHFVMDFDGDY